MTRLPSEKMDDMLFFWKVEQEDHKRLLSFLINTHSDLDRFMQDFYDGHILRNMIVYQNYLRKKHWVDVKTFLSRCQINRLKAIEQLFQEPLIELDMNLLDRYNVSHNDLYTRCEASPHSTYFEAVRHKPLAPRTYSDDFLIIY